ncbi:unnamed protein product [Moneuplotes crassus]|uniref:C2H2-type domain-containing protein n=2 Tax=Euplotes crassus TaxID=5936 RepID=A0AAD1XYX8_EUPCR|nr:unnamed protein product [Moneuplotes crassus]
MAKEHICNYEGCGKKFASNKNLKDHYRTHTGEKPYECEICHKRFGQYSTLHKHKRVHDKKRPYKCEYEGCHKTFTQVSNLIRHRRTHTGDKPYQCKVCNKRFSSSSNLNQHMTIHKDNKNRKKFKCSICLKDYLYPSSLRKHQEMEHKMTKEAIKGVQENPKEEIKTQSHLEETKTPTRPKLNPKAKNIVTKKKIEYEEKDENPTQYKAEKISIGAPDHANSQEKSKIQEPNKVFRGHVKPNPVRPLFKFGDYQREPPNIFNHAGGSDMNCKTLPMPLSSGDNTKISSPNQFLPIGLGQYSNQSNMGYQQIMKMIQDNKTESNYRINTMFLNQSDKQSCISGGSGSVPTFTFQNDDGSLKSGSVSKPFLNEPVMQTSMGHSPDTVVNISKPKSHYSSATFEMRNPRMISSKFKSIKDEGKNERSLSSDRSSPHRDNSPPDMKPYGSKGDIIRNRLQGITNKQYIIENSSLKSETFGENLSASLKGGFPGFGIKKDDEFNRSKFSISSKDSVAKAFGTMKCVAEISPLELRKMVPDLEECQKISIEAFKCDNSCVNGGKCPNDMHRKLQEAMMRSSQKDSMSMSNKF